MTIRVLQWATGNVGRNAVEGVLSHPDLELVGAFVYSPDKVGRDVGELCGTGPVGVVAVGSLDDVVALAPDCVVYAPMLADQDEIRALLRAGIDVVTPVGWFFVGDSPAVAETQAACLAGGATLHGTGIHPGGITEQLPLVLSGFCRDVTPRPGRGVLRPPHLRHRVRGPGHHAVRPHAGGGRRPAPWSTCWATGSASPSAWWPRGWGGTWTRSSPPATRWPWRPRRSTPPWA